MIEQIHLVGKRMSGRGVRVKMLSPDEHGQVLQAASKLCASDSKVLELKKKEWRLGVKQFIVEYTEPCTDPLTAKWVKADLATMDEQFDEIFNAKDFSILESMYRDFHEVDEAEVEAIVGKALPVSGG